MREVWAEGEVYQRFMGRWSGAAATGFVTWLDLGDERTVLDVGCGAGALSAALTTSAPSARVISMDRSPGFVATTRSRAPGSASGFAVADAQRLPLADGAVDGVVSALVLNFLPDAAGAVAEFTRVCRTGGLVAAYVWDYAEGMPMLAHFWEAAVALDPAAERLDERTRFDICRPDRLAALWEGSGLGAVAVAPVQAPMTFEHFDDYWTPFLGGQGPAPTYLMSLPEPSRARLRDEVGRRLPRSPDGRIDLGARAWAVRGTV